MDQIKITSRKIFWLELKFNHIVGVKFTHSGSSTVKKLFIQMIIAKGGVFTPKMFFRNSLRNKTCHRRSEIFVE